jgi:hypothetical protein
MHTFSSTINTTEHAFSIGLIIIDSYYAQVFHCCHQATPAVTRRGSSNAELQAALDLANANGTTSPPNSQTNANSHASTSTITATGVSSVTSAVPVAPSKRGLGYTFTEDLLICRAFIAASEDSIVGISQRGKQFQCQMHALYIQFLKEQYKLDQIKYQGTSCLVRKGAVRRTQDLPHMNSSGCL